MLTLTGFELAPSGCRSAALYLLSYRVHRDWTWVFIQFKCTRYSRDNLTLIHERMCRISVKLWISLSYECHIDFRNATQVVKEEKQACFFFKVIWKSSNIPSPRITLFKSAKTVSLFFHKIIRLNVRNKLQYTFGGRFSMFWYSYPNTGINQSELANESRYFIIYSLLSLPRIFEFIRFLWLP